MGFNYYVEAFNKYADFNGSSNRPEYWYFALWNAIISFAIIMIFGSESIPDLIYSLGVMVPSIAVAVRRLHDVNKSGWNLLWCFTGIGVFYFLYLAVQPSSDAASSVEEDDEEELEIEEEDSESSDNDPGMGEKLKGL